MEEAFVAGESMGLERLIACVLFPLLFDLPSFPLLIIKVYAAAGVIAAVVSDSV